MKSLYDVTVSALLLLAEGALLLISITAFILVVTECIVWSNHMTSNRIIIYLSHLFIGTISTILLLKIREKTHA